MLTGLLAFPAIASENPLFRSNSSRGTQLLVSSDLDPIQINRIHSWRLQLIDAQDNPVTGATIQVSGGMPLHDHGMPTSPRVTAELVNGVYLLEGVRFHMPGDWEISIEVSHGSVSESFVLEFSL